MLIYYQKGGGGHWLSRRGLRPFQVDANVSLRDPTNR